MGVYFADTGYPKQETSPFADTGYPKQETSPLIIARRFRDGRQPLPIARRFREGLPRQREGLYATKKHAAIWRACGQTDNHTDEEICFIFWTMFYFLDYCVGLRRIVIYLHATQHLIHSKQSWQNNAHNTEALRKVSRRSQH